MARTTTAGVTLSATTAIRDGQATYTAEQVGYLLALTYETGRLHGAAEEIAEVADCWREFAQPAATREERVTARLAEMATGVERERRRPQGHAFWHRYVDMDWPETAVPGTVDPTTLLSVYPCPCPRDRNGGHVTPKGDAGQWWRKPSEPRESGVAQKRHLTLVTGPVGGAA